MVKIMRAYDPDQMFKVGTIIGKRGCNGVLVVRPTQSNTRQYLELKCLFVRQNSAQYLPYFVENWEVFDDCLLLNLEEIDSPEIAREFIGTELFVSSGQFAEMDENSFIDYRDYCIEIESAEKGQANINLGAIHAVLQLPQATAQIFLNNKEILIPLHTDYIRNIDHQRKILYMQIPDGLLDIYLN